MTALFGQVSHTMNVPVTSNVKGYTFIASAQDETLIIRNEAPKNAKSTLAAYDCSTEIRAIPSLGQTLAHLPRCAIACNRTHLAFDENREIKIFKRN